MTSAICQALADFRGIIGRSAAHAETRDVWIAVTFKIHGNLYALDITQ
jgi:hypothetical protein